MGQRAPEYNLKNMKILPTNQVLSGGGGGGGGGRKRTEVLSSMIVWNVLLVILLVLAVCVQGQGNVASSDTSPGLALMRLSRASMKREGVGTPDKGDSETSPSQPPQPPQGSVSKKLQDSQTSENSNSGGEGALHGTMEGGGIPQEGKTPGGGEAPPGETRGDTPQGGKGGGTQQGGKVDGKEAPQGVKGGDGATQLVPETKTGNSTITSKGKSAPVRPPTMSTEAVLRGFYVFVGIGAILLVYIVIKLVRIQKRRAPGKYRVLPHADDQEMFPLAAGDGEDEEIFNAAHHHPRK